MCGGGLPGRGKTLTNWDESSGGQPGCPGGRELGLLWMEKRPLKDGGDLLAIFSYLVSGYEKMEPDSPWSCKMKDKGHKLSQGKSQLGVR